RDRVAVGTVVGRVEDVAVVIIRRRVLDEDGDHLRHLATRPRLLELAPRLTRRARKARRLRLGGLYPVAPLDREAERRTFAEVTNGVDDGVALGRVLRVALRQEHDGA